MPSATTASERPSAIASIARVIAALQASSSRLAMKPGFDAQITATIFRQNL
jgi:hypothetical protein